MTIISFKHKGLRRLYENDDTSRVPVRTVRKLRRILAALTFANDLSEVQTVPGWRLHALKGDRRGVYSIALTGNWRLTFRSDGKVLSELNVEDYH